MNEKKKTNKECGTQDFRCLCGSLMAKIIPSGIEIKCRRCKRIHHIPAQSVEVDKRVRPETLSIGAPVSVKGGSYA